MLIYDQFGIIQILHISPIPQTSNWSSTFFAVSYSKPALDKISTVFDHRLDKKSLCLGRIENHRVFRTYRVSTSESNF